MTTQPLAPITIFALANLDGGIATSVTAVDGRFVVVVTVDMGGREIDRIYLNDEATAIQFAEGAAL